MLNYADILGPSGRIAARLPKYEHRPEQLAMAGAVDRAIRQRRHLVAEAGTGVGKSFAYLVPAILSVAAERPPEKGETKRRAVISTHTISLQEQLIAKDIPLLNSVIPLEFTAVLVKGRGNYISLRRLDTALSRGGGLFDDPRHLDELRRIRDWAKWTTDGSLADLDFRPAPAVWDEVQSDHGNCMGRACPRYTIASTTRPGGGCRHAQLLIVNHALFFTDLALRPSRPACCRIYQTVVLDEAHTLEATAGEYLGLKSPPADRSSTRAAKALTPIGPPRAAGPPQTGSGPKGRLGMPGARRGDLFDSLARWLDERHGGNGRVREPDIVANPLDERLRKLVSTLRRHAQDIEQPEQRMDFTSAANRLEALCRGISDWLGQEMPDSVYWLERGGGRGRMRIELAAAPIDVGPILREQLFSQVPTVCDDQRHAIDGSEAAATRRSIFSKAAWVWLLRCRGVDAVRRSKPGPRRLPPASIRSGKAAPSTINARRNWCCCRTCPTPAKRPPNTNVKASI